MENDSQQQHRDDRLLTPAFVAVTAATSLYFFGYGVVTPVLPHFVTTTLGAGNLAVGVVTGIFAASAVLTRPVAGRFGNRFGRRMLMVSGALCAGCSIALYGLANGIGALIALRLLTGVGEGLFYTGAATTVADLAPAHRRGEAISYLSAALWLGNGLGPAIGQMVFKSVGPKEAFLVAAGFSLAALGCSMKAPALRFANPSGVRQPLVNKKAIAPGASLALVIAGTVAFNAYVPLYVSTIHLNGPQFVFIEYAAIMMGARGLFAKLPDRWGAAKTGVSASIGMAAGFFAIALFHSALGLYLGTAVLAAGNSFTFPAMLSMAVRDVTAEERSSVIGTFTAFFDISSGLGGLSLGAVVSLGGYRAGFAGGGVYALLGLSVLWFGPLRHARHGIRKAPQAAKVAEFG